MYLTSHQHGIVVFMEISEALDPVQKLVRASTKQASRVEKSGQEELFAAGDLVESDDQTVDIAEVERVWLEQLPEQAKRFGEAEFAELLEETDWFPGDLQSALGNLINSGKARNLDMTKPRRKKFLHFEKGGERLQRIGGSKLAHRAGSNGPNRLGTRPSVARRFRPAARTAMQRPWRNV